MNLLMVLMIDVQLNTPRGLIHWSLLTPQPPLSPPMDYQFETVAAVPSSPPPSQQQKMQRLTIAQAIYL
jgi:hypothetical protein